MRTTDLVIACKSADRFFDLDAVRQPHTAKPQRRFAPQGGGKDPSRGKFDSSLRDSPDVSGHPAGAPPLDHWWIDPSDDTWTPPEGAPMGNARFIIGDSLTVLRSMPDASVDFVLTSPPFLALRSYLPQDHPDKAREMGSEATPGAFIDALLDIVEECRRVLAPHGSLCFELGDTYSNSGGAGGDYAEDGLREGQQKFRQQTARDRGWQGSTPKDDEPMRTRSAGGHGWPMAKSLALIPESFRWALAYGRNPFTGRETPRWRVRNVVRWCRPNPPVGALGDKFRPATSDMVIACTAQDRYFDLDSVREPHKEPWRSTGKPESMGRARVDPQQNKAAAEWFTKREYHPAGAPPLDHWWHDEDSFDQDAWLIPTHGFKGAHYATFPPALLVTPIKAMCPREVCRTCGEPSRRIVGEVSPRVTGSDVGKDRVQGRVGGPFVKSHTVTLAETVTLGFTDCGHDNYRPGVTLDPFCGSGTTLAVATGHGRDAIGIDLDSRNADLARERVGMWLTVEHHDDPVEAA